MPVTFDVPFDTSFYAGGANTTLVPRPYHVSLGGRPYMIDFSQPFYRQYKRQIAPLLRTQSDTSTDPGEQSMDPNSLWRRSFEDWSLGAGQRFLDRHDSVSNRFYTSKGIDCLTTRWQITLLPDTTNTYSTSEAQQMVVAGDHLYITDGETLKYSTDGSTFTTVTGTPAHTPSSMCTDGYNVWVAYAAGGIYSTTAGASSASQYISDSLDAAAVVGFVNGRLMVGNLADLYNVTSSGTLPTALFTQGNSEFRWVAFAEGPTALYAAGSVGNKGYLYGTGILTDGTALDAPIIQGRLPDGETVETVYGYLGNLVIGTSLGVRFATVDSAGSVTIESLIPTPNPVLCAVGYNRWVWFGWTDYDSVSTGLGRMDLENFVIEDVQPAYASDLMATTQGNVTGVVNFGGDTYFAVDGEGIYVQTTDLVASGNVVSGYVLYDLIDLKVPALLNLQTDGPLAYGSYSGAVASDAGDFVTVGTHNAGDPEPVTYRVSGNGAQRFEVKLTLSRDSDSTSSGPTFNRWTFQAYPAPRRALTWQLPLILNEEIVNNSGASSGFDPLAELLALENWANTGAVVTYQEGHQAYPVFVQDVSWYPDYTTEDFHWENGMALVSLKGLPVEV